MMAVTSRNPLVHAVLLGGIAMVAAVFLVLGDMGTKHSIEQRKREDLVRSLQMVIPARLHDNDLTRDIVMISDGAGKSTRVYRARRGNRVTAVAFRRIVHGYGRIELVMGIDAGGRVLGVRVLEHTETPGLGDKIEARKSDWIKGFDGLSLDNTPAEKWRVRKDGGIFDQFSGATITPRAVVKAVHQGLEFFQRHKNKMFAALPLSRLQQVDGEPDHE